MALYNDLNGVDNPTPGQPGKAAWGDTVRDNFEAIVGAANPRCAIFNSGDITINNATSTTMTFDSERFDHGGLHSTISGTSRISFTEPGVYLVGAGLAWAVSGAGTRWAFLQLNGTTLIAGDGPKPGHAALNAHNNLSRLYLFTTNDYIELVGYQDSGGALNARSVPNASIEMWAQWKAAA